jgi:DUF2975 family protein
MRKLGNKSLSSILLIITKATWWAECIFAGIVSALAVGMIFVKKDVTFNAPVSFSAVTFRYLKANAADSPQGHLNITKGLFYLPLECKLETIATLLAIFWAFFSLVLLVTYQLKKIFASFRQDEPFIASNTIRVRNIGVIVLAYALLQFLFDAGFNRYLLSHFTWTADLRLTCSFNFTALLTGIAIIIIAEIFRLGSALENEQKLTI